MNDIAILLGPVSGNIYRIGSTSTGSSNCYLHIHNSNGIFLQEVVISTTHNHYKSAVSSDELLLVVCHQGGSNFIGYASTNNGSTWTTVSGYGDSMTNPTPYACGAYIVSERRQYASGGYKYYYDSIQKNNLTLERITSSSANDIIHCAFTNSHYFIYVIASKSNYQSWSAVVCNLDTNAKLNITYTTNYDYTSLQAIFYGYGIVGNDNCIYFHSYDNIYSVPTTGGALTCVKARYPNTSEEYQVIKYLTRTTNPIKINNYYFSDKDYVRPSYKTDYIFGITICKPPESVISFLSLTGISNAQPTALNVYGGYLYIVNEYQYIIRVPISTITFASPLIVNNERDSYIRF